MVGPSGRKELPLVVALTALPPLAAVGPLIGGPVNPFRLLAGALVAWWGWQAARSRGLTRLETVILAASGVVLVSAAVSYLRFGWPLSGLGELVSLLLGLLLIAALVHASGHVDVVRWLLRGYILMVLGLACVVAWEYATDLHLPNFVVPYEDRNSTGLWDSKAGTFTNPNQLAHVLVFSQPLLVAAACLERGRWRLVAAASAVLAFVLAYPTNSRVGWALTAATALAVLASRRWGRWTLGAALLALAIPAVRSLVLSPVLTRLSKKEAIDADDPRLKMLRNGWSLLVDSGFLGVGPEAFTHRVAAGAVPEPTEIVNPHNGVLEVLVQYGLPVFAVLLAGLGWALVRAIRSGGGPLLGAICLVILEWGPSTVMNSTWLLQATTQVEIAAVGFLLWHLGRGQAPQAAPPVHTGAGTIPPGPDTPTG